MTGMENNYKTFRQLTIGQRFDFVGPNPTAVSFWKPCTKTSAKKYTDDDGLDYRVGSVLVIVYHVDEV